MDPKWFAIPEEYLNEAEKAQHKDPAPEIPYAQMWQTTNSGCHYCSRDNISTEDATLVGLILMIRREAG